MKIQNVPLAFLLALLLIALPGCGEDAHDHPDVDVEACEHLQEGPSSPVNATTSSTGAPSISTAHTRFDVSLPAGTGGNAGFVSFLAAEATDYAFFMSADVPVAFFDAANVPLTPETTAKSSVSCPEIKAKYVLPLAVGPVSLKLGPTTLMAVSIVTEEAAHEHDEQ